jgi:hypothetical protein
LTKTSETTGYNERLEQKLASIFAGGHPKYHEKMKEINRQLSDFWKMTYKGNDIDTIEIRSDCEKNQQNSKFYSFHISEI